jgi:hypothetical protein
LHDEIQGSTLTLLPGLGHMIHYDAQDEIAGAVREVLGRARAGAPIRPPGRPTEGRTEEAFSASADESTRRGEEKVVRDLVAAP